MEKLIRFSAYIDNGHINKDHKVFDEISDRNIAKCCYLKE